MCAMGFKGAPPIELRYLGPLERERVDARKKPPKSAEGRERSTTSKEPPSFELLQPLTWVSEDGTAKVPAGFVTDFASVPRFLWGLIASYGKQTLPAILHDYASWKAKTLAERRAADDLFRVALEDQGVANLRATAMWAAVGLATQRDDTLSDWVPWRGARYIAQMLIGVLTIWGAVFMPIFTCSWWPWNLLWVLLLFVPQAFGWIWGVDQHRMLTGTYVFALFLPLLVGAGLNALAYFVISWVAWKVTGGKGAAPDLRSTIKLDFGP